jgi:uncharacterized protein
MPAALTYPGVYIEEIPSGVHSIVGVSTSDTAFIDWFPQGPLLKATVVTSWPDFVRKFGGLNSASEASYAIQQFYLNGGQIAWVVRVATGAYLPATLGLSSGPAGSGSGYAPGSSLTVTAASPGTWGNGVQVRVRYPRAGPGTTFNLDVRQTVPGPRGPMTIGSPETYLNLTMKQGDPMYAVDVVNAKSQLIQLTDGAAPGQLGAIPQASPVDAQGNVQWSQLSGGNDGDVPGGIDGQWALSAPTQIANNVLTIGSSPLEQIAPQIFNIMCIPAAAKFPNPGSVYAPALAFCEAKRAFLIVDLPDSVSSDMVSNWLDTENLHVGISNGAVYFPGLTIPDRLNGMRDRAVGPSGTIAGIYSRTDSTRGVWKAPAGIDAALIGVSLPQHLTDLEDGLLNPEGINVLRAFPLYGNVVWGARTLLGADQEASEWKYIPIRRLALFLEETLYESTKWVVFEPNDEPLWAQIRLNVGAFMHSLFLQGAFQGKAPKDAYFVKCDAETTTQNDRDLGIVNILVGFAPLKPAEFVVFQIQQIAGAIVTG